MNLFMTTPSSKVFEQHFKLTPVAYRKLVKAKVFHA